MPLEFGDDFCAACETIAGIWLKGNDPLRCHLIARIAVVDVHLPDIHAISLDHLNIHKTILLTVLVITNMLSRATKW